MSSQSRFLLFSVYLCPFIAPEVEQIKESLLDQIMIAVAPKAAHEGVCVCVRVCSDHGRG